MTESTLEPTTPPATAGPKQFQGVRYGTIGIAVLSFALGIVAAALFANAEAAETTSFTTPELLGFVLSVLVSGASIVLAISAIMLGRSSEQAVIMRSDESIRLQNEVFAKTTDALQRIESSTGVTEKRIEDIISGRVGAISSEVAANLTGGLNTEEIEKELRASLLESFSEQRNTQVHQDRQARLEKRRQEEARYEEEHNRIQLGIANADDVQVERLGHGRPADPQSVVYDCLFRIGGRRVALTTVRPHRPTFLEVLAARIAGMLSADEALEYFVVFFETEDFSADGAASDFRELMSPYKEAVSARAHPLTHQYGADVEPVVSSVVRPPADVA